MAAVDLRILELRRRASVALQGVEDAASDAVSALIQTVINAMIAYLEANPSDTVDDLMEILSAVINDGALRAADAMVAMGADVIDVSAAAQAASSELMGITTANEINAAVDIWTNQNRVALLQEGHQLWYQKLKQDALHPGGVLRSSLEAANVWGESMNDAADRLIEADPDFSSFPPLDMDPIARARMIVRTESTRFDNAVSVSLAESVGITDFVNVGVGDERQSDICQGATEQGPMSLDEWKSSPWGVAPRHPNCRCAMVGVGAEFDASDTQKRNAGVMN